MKGLQWISKAQLFNVQTVAQKIEYQQIGYRISRCVVSVEHLS